MTVRSSYRTSDGQADYRFSFEQQRDGSYRAYISSQPGYNGQSTSLHATHRLRDGGRHYVCWTKPLQSLSEAKAVASTWADATQEYRRTGRRF